MTYCEKRWTDSVKKALVGRKIIKVEYMPHDEAQKAGWEARPICIKLDNGSWIVPMMDDEGNNGGAMSTTNKNIPIIPVIR